MGNSAESHAARDIVLARTKSQYEPGPMRPRLYEILQSAHKDVASPSYAWMYYAGMGDVALNDVTPVESSAIKELLDSGRLVPTFEEDFYGIKKIRLVQHFDDVNFGLDENDNIIIYDFASRVYLPDNIDPVIRPSEIHSAAIEQIKKRINFSVPSHAITVDKSPIQLHGGPVIRPLITNAHLTELRLRQREFTP